MFQKIYVYIKHTTSLIPAKAYFTLKPQLQQLHKFHLHIYIVHLFANDA